MQDVQPPRPEELLAERVRRLRADRGWSQEELAHRMRRAGFKWLQSTAAKTEANDRPIRLDEAAALAELFGVGVDDLIEPKLDAISDRLLKLFNERLAAEEAFDLAERELREKESEHAVADGARMHLDDQIDALQPLRPPELGLQKKFSEPLTDDELCRLVTAFWKNDEWIVILEEAGYDEPGVVERGRELEPRFLRRHRDWLRGEH